MQFKLNWKLTLFSLILFPILMSLAVWQLYRAQEKELMIKQWETDTHTQTLVLNNDNIEDVKNFQTTKLEGRFDYEKYWLQEAKIVRGRPGYNVIMPLETPFATFLIDRGWVEANPNRRVLPAINKGPEHVIIEGMLTEANKVALISEKNNPLVHWPHRILSIDIKIMSEQYKKPLFNRVFSLNQFDAYAFSVVPKTVNIKPEKHRAYAVQWFAMALSLFVMWLLTNTNLIDIINKKNKRSL